ncbi:MAG TPA: type II CAAX endopeptidase family protein [Polyangiaceae bacterium]
MFRWGRFATAYLAMGIVALVLAVIWREESPFQHPAPLLELAPRASHTYSAMLGLVLGASVVGLTRPMVTRLGWARTLHIELRRLVAQDLSFTGIVVLAILSALGEELLFRGLLHSWLGLLPQAIIFGLVHQIPGKSRWVWVTWATLMGFLLGGVFQLTGSLLGPIVAHGVINGFNLQYLKTHDPEPRPRPLGGLLGQRS